MFQPPPPTYADNPNIIHIDIDHGQHVVAEYLPNESAYLTVLYSHGTGEDLGSVRPLLEGLQAHGFAVFAYDYRGYGRSKGNASEQNAYEDITAVYVYLVNELGTLPRQIISYGRSLGGGPATYLASHYRVGGLVLESAFVSALRVRTAIPLFPFDRFSNISRINQVKYPVLIMHSRDDKIVPFWHAELLFKRANDPKSSYWADNAGHLGIPWSGDGYWQSLGEFSILLSASQDRGTVKIEDEKTETCQFRRQYSHAKAQRP